MKTTLLVLAALLLPLGASAPAPDALMTDGLRERGLPPMDLSGARVQRLDLPAGSALQVAFAEGGPVLSAVPPGPAPMGHGQGGVADCVDDQAYLRVWVPVDPDFPKLNLASLGECQYDVHFRPVLLMAFASHGDGHGWADAYDYATGSYFYVQCSGGAVLGAGAPGPWSETPVGTCMSYARGLTPDRYTYWDSLVANEQSGVTSVEWHA